MYNIYSQSCYIKLPWLYLILFISVITFSSTYAQNPTLDSLYTVLSTTTINMDRLVLMDQLVDELITVDLDQALSLANEALELSKQKGDKKAEAIAYNNLGLVLYETKDRAVSLLSFQESERLAAEMGLAELQSLNLMNLSRYYRYHDYDSTKTVNYLLKSVDVSKAADYYWGTGRSYAKLASFYAKFNDIELIENYLKLAAEYYSHTVDADITTAHYYNEIGDKLWDANPNRSMDFYLKGMEYSETPNLMVSLAKAYSFTGDNDEALLYLNRAIPLYREMKSKKRVLGIALAQLADVYLQMGNYQAADVASDEGISLLENIGRSSQKAIPSLYRSKGIVMEEKGNDQAAVVFYQKSLSEAIRIKFGYEKNLAQLTLGKFYTSRDVSKAKEYCAMALRQLETKKNTIIEIQACDCMYRILKEGKSYAEALKYYEQKILLSDSLNATKVKYTLDINDRLSEKDQLIEAQKYQKVINDKELKNQQVVNSTLLISILLGLLLIGFLTMGYFRIRKQNEEIVQKTEDLVKANVNLEQSNQELERFAHITSHDLKTPIRSILSFAGLLRRKMNPEKDSPENGYLTFIENSGRRMKQLIEDILEFSQLSGNTTIDMEVVNLNQLVEELSQISQNTPEAPQVQFEVAELPDVNWYYSKVFLLFKNLIENGIKYNKSELPTIKVYAVYELKGTSICIEDNGIGVDQKYFDKIFIMFNRLHNQQDYDGTGLGLATCKKIVDEFEGNISITSEIDKGTIFKIDFPDHLVKNSTAKLV